MTKKTLPKMFLILLFFTTPLLPMWSFADDTGDARYYYAFNGDAGEQIANLAQPDESKDRLVYHPNGETLQWVDGIVPGLKAARLDRAYFEAPALTPSGKAFSFTIWFRKNGPGLLTGNNGSKTGTIIGMGDGYWSGMRVTTSDSSKRVAFHIGRPQPSSAVTLESQDDVYDGVWNHLAVTWDGRQMRIYLNGIISGVRDYDGAFTPPNWGLRVGFNDAGIGSINMDVQQLASYDRALTPFEVFTQATSVDDGNEKPLPTPPITNPPLSTPEQREAMVLFLSERIASGKKWTDKDEDQFFEQFGRLSRHTNFLSKMQRETIWLMFAKLRPTRELPHEIFLTYVSSEDTSKLIRDRLLRSLVPNATGTPMIRVPLEVYEKLLAEVSMSPEEKRQLETIIDQLKAFQAGGRPLSERSRSRSESGYPPTELKSLALLDDKLATTIRATDRESVKFDWSQYVGESGKSFDTLHVAPHGKADNTGSLESPFGSLEQARNKIRQLHRAFGRGIEVLVHGGKYDIRETITFDEIHSGTADSPVVYRNAPGETPVFSGGLNISGAFEKVSDATILARVPESVRGELMVADLKTLGVTGSLFPIPERGYGRNGPDAAPWFEVYVDGKPQQIARYPNYDADAPNDCFILTGEVSQGKSDTPSQRQPGVFKYADDRASRWAADEDVWLFGYWRHLWAATSHPVASIDSAARTITMARPDGYGYYENMPFYAFNIFSEIDVPGEWWLDRKTNRLYILPPLDDDGQPVDLNSVSVMIPQFDGPFIECRNVSHVTFHGLNMGDCAGTAFKSYGGERLLLAGCTFERLGNWAIAMHDGKHNGVYGCDMTWLGGGGVTISGGNLRTLEPGNCFVENCRVSHFTLVDRVYAPAVSLDGVGNSVASNVFEDSPHHGIRMGGFDHTIEYNRINRVVQESDDQSGIDMWGDPVCRGNLIRYNYWSNIGNQWNVAGQSGIRLDDMISGVVMYGNIFVRSAGGRFGAIQIHGGKDNIAENNLIVDSQAAFSYSPWGERRWLENLKPESHFWKRSTIDAGIDPAKPPHIDRYPDLADLPKNADRNYIVGNIAFVNDAFDYHEHGQNVVHDNIAVAQGVVRAIFHETDWFKTSLDGTKITLPPNDSPFYTATGFRPLPLEKMGNYADSRLPNSR